MKKGKQETRKLWGKKDPDKFQKVLELQKLRYSLKNS